MSDKYEAALHGLTPEQRHALGMTAAKAAVQGFQAGLERKDDD
jgi:hypothetical protein